MVVLILLASSKDYTSKSIPSFKDFSDISVKKGAFFYFDRLHLGTLDWICVF